MKTPAKGHQTRAKDVGGLGRKVNPGRYASPKTNESAATLTPQKRGFDDILEARRHMSTLKERVPVGGDLLVNGKLMQRQPSLRGREFGHPDSVPLLAVGYGPGRFNENISVSALNSGQFVVEIPED